MKALPQPSKIRNEITCISEVATVPTSIFKMDAYINQV